MKKAVKANIAGRVFTLNEDAYQRLEKYLNNIEHYFGSNKTGKKILSNIEMQISEMFSEKLTNSKQVINMDDVKDVIGKLGYPENSDKSNKKRSKSNSNKDFVTINRPRKLYRNPDDAIFGGICSGLAFYWNISTIIIRAIFLVALFFGGVTLVAYIILWILIPKARTFSQKLEMRGEKITIS